MKKFILALSLLTVSVSYALAVDLSIPGNYRCKYKGKDCTVVSNGFIYRTFGDCPGLVFESKLKGCTKTVPDGVQYYLCPHAKYECRVTVNNGVPDFAGCRGNTPENSKELTVSEYKNGKCYLEDPRFE